MKTSFALLALAASAFASDLAPRWHTSSPTEETTTYTTYTTTTYCPVTSTYTEASLSSSSYSINEALDSN
jgi:hypothetical protein